MAVPRRKSRRRDVTRDVRTSGSSICRVWLSARSAVSTFSLTEFARLAEPTMASRSSTLKADFELNMRRAVLRLFFICCPERCIKN